ncbi:hypothetical protein GCM10022267_89970 [Lentzea roselyniae]|uniref:Uncharacterized protein n=1 Tax=Lentzea roselyniae TaxID=531940 RepID=A0ABP7CJ76_9PSEU
MVHHESKCTKGPPRIHREFAGPRDEPRNHESAPPFELAEQRHASVKQRLRPGHLNHSNRRSRGE